MEILPLILVHLAWAKIVLIVGFTVLVLLLTKKHDKPLDYVLILSAMFGIFAFLIVWPQNTLLFGNVGDELYMGANFARMAAGSFSADFYYALLPPYYPPLYFWIIGLITGPFVSHGLVAYKISAIVSSVVLFVGTYGWLALAQRVGLIKTHAIVRILIPLCFTITLPFDAFLGKPHEALSALLAVLLTAGLIRILNKGFWSLPLISFITVSSAVIILTFYFWGFVMIPVLLFFALMSDHPFINIGRLIALAILALFVSLPYIYPFFASLIDHSFSVSQGTFFSLSDVQFPPLTLPFALGFAGLVLFNRLSIVRGALAIFFATFLYQAVGLAHFITGLHPLLPSKPFEYLAGAALAVGLTYVCIGLHVSMGSLAQYRIPFIVLSAGFIAYFSPFVALADNVPFVERMNRNTLVPQEMVLAEDIRQTVPDWNTRIWLASTRPAVNIYIPLFYYIAHNEHYSHFAAGFSDRLTHIKSLSESKNAKHFFEDLSSFTPQPNALLLFYDKQTDSYPIDFWVDNFPNGGREYRVSIPAHLISDEYWRLEYDKSNWRIFTPQS